VKTQRSVASALHYNVVYQNADPVFKDASSNDYHLKATSVNAIDKGDPALTATFPIDIEAYPRSGLPDLGAYEFH
jgi:hypothetical protein